MDKILKILKLVKDYFLVAVILVLLVVIYFKNNKIDKLTEELAKKPTIEYIYDTKIDTIEVLVPEPVEVIKWRDNPKVDTSYIQLDLTASDSSKIAQEYTKLYRKYAETKIYDDVLKDDSTAFIQLQEKVQFNSVFDRNLIFKDRTPVVNITKTVIKQDKTFSIVGGIDASVGPDFNAFSVGAGIVTHKNAIYLGRYDPVNDGWGVAIYIPVFNLRK